MSGTLRNLERILQDLGRLPEEVIQIIVAKVREMWLPQLRHIGGARFHLDSFFVWRPPSLDLHLCGWGVRLKRGKDARKFMSSSLYLRRGGGGLTGNFSGGIDY